MTVSACLRQSHHLGTVSHLPSPTLEWCCWKEQLCLSAWLCCDIFLRAGTPHVGVSWVCWVIPALRLLPGSGLAPGVGKPVPGVQEAEGLVIKVLKGWWLRSFYRHLSTYCSQLPAFISRRQVLSICIYTVLRSACSCREWQEIAGNSPVGLLPWPLPSWGLASIVGIGS